KLSRGIHAPNPVPTFLLRTRAHALRRDGRRSAAARCNGQFASNLPVTDKGFGWRGGVFGGNRDGCKRSAGHRSAVLLERRRSQRTARRNKPNRRLSTRHGGHLQNYGERCLKTNLCDGNRDATA